MENIVGTEAALFAFLDKRPAVVFWMKICIYYFRFIAAHLSILMLFKQTFAIFYNIEFALIY